MDSVLDVRNVTKSYPGFTLENVSFTLPRGYIMGLIGPNGAGKTTVLKAVLDLIRLDRGEIRVMGMDHRREGARARARIGFVHEVPTFYSNLTVERAAGVLARFYRAWDEARFLTLAEDFHLPMGKKLGRLSQGMRTRFALSIALSHHAELLLLDEPSSGLDPAFRREFLERLSGVIEGGETSVLFSTHITSDLDRVADYVTFLRQGRLVFSRTREEVLECWAVVRGGLGLLDTRIRSLLAGVVTGDFGFVAVTDRVNEVRKALEGEAAVVEPATLEDVVYYAGRTGKEGLRLHGLRN